MLGPRLAKLVTDDYAMSAVVSWARSFVRTGDLNETERDQAREVEAAIEAMYLMATADGELAQAELALLSASVGAMVEACEGTGASRSELGLPVLKLGELIGRFERRLAAEGLPARWRSVTERLVSLPSRRLAFRLAAGVAFADDFVAHGEVESLDALAEALGFAKDEALSTLKEVHTALGV